MSDIISTNTTHKPTYKYIIIINSLKYKKENNEEYYDIEFMKIIYEFSRI